MVFLFLSPRFILYFCLVRAGWTKQSLSVLNVSGLEVISATTWRAALHTAL